MVEENIATLIDGHIDEILIGTSAYFKDEVIDFYVDIARNCAENPNKQDKVIIDILEKVLKRLAENLQNEVYNY